MDITLKLLTAKSRFCKYVI